jgi:uncharacterized protein (DUF934 family)
MNMLELRAEIIKHHEVVANDWAVLRLDAAASAAVVADPAADTGAPGADAAQLVVPAGKVIVPLAVWQAQRATLIERARAGTLGVWLPPDAQAQVLQEDGVDLNLFAVIAVDFPKFTDGRGYSIGYNLRARLGFTGELRAIGDVLRDQMFYMQRVGFDTYEPRADKNIHDALKGLTVFSQSYQQSLDQKNPLFRRVQRGTGAAT